VVIPANINSPKRAIKNKFRIKSPEK